MRTILCLVCLLAAPLAGPAPAADITQTPHNLTAGGPGTVKSTTGGEVCLFCHTPHHANPGVYPLWNRSLSTGTAYRVYQSSTLDARPGQPTGSSKLCLSCHDGTIALGSLRNVPQPVPFAGGVTSLPPGPSNLGTDLSDDHPISFPFSASLAAANPELAGPTSLPSQIRLDTNGELQCTACHDPHDNSFGKFLVMNNIRSSLCTQCHQPANWPQTPHSTSVARWNGAGINPWPHTAWTTVADNGCEGCHRPHTAGLPSRLLNYSREEDNCLGCHNGNVARYNLGTEIAKAYTHDPMLTTGIHDPLESGPGSASHVECSDCHNAHQARHSDPVLGQPASISLALLGARGITSAGGDIRPVITEQQICYRCHSEESPRLGRSLRIDRVLSQFNTRAEFSPSSPSYHPIETQGINPSVPSLRAPLTITSKIKCTDCHNNDSGRNRNGAGPMGPHGSIYPYLLERRYETTDPFSESAAAYDLCYKCHDRTNILADRSFSKHHLHISDENTPCSTCHDPHGIDSTKGNATKNSRLINFASRYVFPNSSGRLEFVKTANGGTCSLRCHGKNHSNFSYTVSR